jgi:hypothetical protein
VDISEKARHAANRILFGMPDRYGHLAREITNNQSRTILEIGVWDGEHSGLMLQAALRNHAPADVSYYGFDLFEEADEAVISQEASKFPPSMASVRRKLQSFAERGACIELFKGNTLEVLPAVVDSLPKMDFVFIDGGHSYETVRNDWECVRRLLGTRSVVIFDDYVNGEAIGQTSVGVNRLVDEIDGEIYSVSRLRPVDVFRKSWGTLKVRFVKVTPRPERRPSREDN